MLFQFVKNPDQSTPPTWFAATDTDTGPTTSDFWVSLAASIGATLSMAAPADIKDVTDVESLPSPIAHILASLRQAFPVSLTKHEETETELKDLIDAHTALKLTNRTLHESHAAEIKDLATDLADQQREHDTIQQVNEYLYARKRRTLAPKHHVTQRAPVLLTSKRKRQKILDSAVCSACGVVHHGNSHTECPVLLLLVEKGIPWCQHCAMLNHTTEACGILHPEIGFELRMKADKRREKNLARAQERKRIKLTTPTTAASPFPLPTFPHQAFLNAPPPHPVHIMTPPHIMGPPSMPCHVTPLSFPLARPLVPPCPP